LSLLRSSFLISYVDAIIWIYLQQSAIADHSPAMSSSNVGASIAVRPAGGLRASAGASN